MATFTNESAPLVAATGVVRPFTGVLDPDSLSMRLALQWKTADLVVALLVDERVPDWCPNLLRPSGGTNGVHNVAKDVKASPGTADGDDDAVLAVQEANSIRVPRWRTANKGEEHNVILFTLVRVNRVDAERLGSGRQ